MRIRLTSKSQNLCDEVLADQLLKLFSDLRGEQLSRLGVAGPCAPPKASAIHDHRSIVGIRPALDLLVADAREVDRQIDRTSKLLASLLQTDHVIIGVGSDRICGISGVEK